MGKKGRARGGVESKRYHPGGIVSTANMANFLVDPALKPSHGTTPLPRLFPPNGFGLFDMAGNVWGVGLRLVRSALLRHGPVRGIRPGPPVGPPPPSSAAGGWLVADVRIALLQPPATRWPPEHVFVRDIGFLRVRGVRCKRRPR